MAEALQQKIEEKRKEKAALVDSIQEANKETSQLDERQKKTENLKSEAGEHNAETEKLQEYVNTAKEEVASFPSDSQMLKLERRLESLKNQMRDGERNIMQRETGIQAYQDRLKETSENHRTLHEEAQNKNQMMECHAQEGKTTEAGVVQTEQIIQAMDTLTQIAQEREAELSSLQSQLVDAINEESERSGRIREIQEQAEAEGPRIESQKEKDCAAIQQAWDREHKFLQQTYDRLYDINKEQQYHLSRGTHIKKKIEKPSHVAETSLSHRHARLAQDINEARSRYKDVSDDLNYNKKQTEAVRNQGRNAHAKFKQEKEVKEDELAQASAEREDVADEGIQLKQAKADLSQLLATIRDT